MDIKLYNKVLYKRSILAYILDNKSLSYVKSVRLQITKKME